MTDNPRSPDAVRLERVFDAPINLVWQMWTVSEHFAQWYGPDGATIVVAQMDVRPGGTRHVGMEVMTPGGPMRMWFTGEYREVVTERLLAYTESISDEHGAILAASDRGMPADHPIVTEVRVELDDLGGSTRMIITHAGIPADSPGALGWAMACDKLATVLAARR